MLENVIVRGLSSFATRCLEILGPTLRDQNIVELHVR